jgi:hypothetical protein
VFISSAREDSGVVLRLAKDLKQAGVSVWVSKSDLRPGQEWSTDFQQALLTSRAVIVILSPAAVESSYLLQEVSVGLTIGKIVIPLLFQDCDIPSPLPRSVYVDFRSDYNEGLQYLLRELAQLAGEAEGTPTSYVRYEESPNTLEQAEVVLKAELEWIAREQVEAASKAKAEPIEREEDQAGGEGGEDEYYEEGQLKREMGEALPTSRGDSDERVHFTVYHPQAVSRERTSRLLAYAHIAEAASSIQAHAGAILENLREVYKRQSGLATVDIQQGASITVAPYLPNCRFEPRIATFRWLEEWHCVSFALGMERDAPSGNVDGSVDFFVGPVLVASVRITVYCSATPAASGLVAVPLSTTPYNSIFVSYSHRDSKIVDGLQQAYRVLGMKYLRDVDELRSGEDWSAALCGFIEKADIFQLCWSRSAKSSAYVEREWRYASALHRPFFIRPVYWEKPMPSPPVELKDLHFAQLRLQDHIPWWKVPIAKFLKCD